MKSPIYVHPRLYEASMRLLYGLRYYQRYEEVAEYIPGGITVTDVCAGDCALYRFALKQKLCRYQACDINPNFVRWAEKQGFVMHQADIRIDEIPPADCVVMMGSLCQFIPNERDIMVRLIDAARKRVVISEPVRTWARSRFLPARWAARHLVRLDDGPIENRFTTMSLTQLFCEFGFQVFHPIAGGREIVACLEK